MILTNAKAYESLVVLSQVEEKGMLGYAVMRNRQKLLAELQDYCRKRDELAAQYGTDIGNGQIRIDGENAARFREELQPYSELTVDVHVMQVSPEIFYGGNLTSSQMFTLDWMVKE